MKTIAYIPKSKDSYFIDRIWVSKADNFTSRGVLFPMQNQELVFDLSDKFVLTKYNGEFTQLKQNWIAGVHTQPLVSETAGKLLSIGFLFKPWGLYQLLGINASELVNKTINASDIIPLEMRDYIYENLYSDTFLREPKKAESYLMQQFKLKHIDNRFIKTVSLLSGDVTRKGIIGNYMHEFSKSSKSYINSFKRIFGLSPIKYFHFLLVNKGIKDICSFPQKPLTQIALENGFYDQSHFIRIFKSFLKISPNRYRKLVRNGKVKEVSPNYADL